MHPLPRFLIFVASAIAILVFVLLTVYAAMWFAIWWPTVFGIDGTWRAYLALVTALPLFVWLGAYEWPLFTARIRRWLGMGIEQ